MESGIGAKMTRLSSSCFNTNRIPDGQTFFTLLDKVSCNKILDDARYMLVSYGKSGWLYIFYGNSYKFRRTNLNIHRKTFIQFG
jgi:hypothetical protein